jgi:Protein of unknown function (DUF559)
MREIAVVAGRQDGVISRTQLRHIGLTDREIDGLVRRGYLLPLYRAVYAVGHRRLTTNGHLKAALLATGPTAFLSHRTAAALWGLRSMTVRRIDVTLPGSHRRSRGSLRLHRTAGRLDRSDVATRSDLRVSSVPRVLVELAPSESPGELDRLITAAVRKGILDLAKMPLTLARHAGRPGLTKLNTTLKEYLPKPDRKSGLEVAFDQLLACHPEIPPPRRNVHIAGWEIDCYWPEQRLAVELDGRPYHVAVKDIERDRLKDAKLLGIGIRVMRVTDNRFEHDPLGALNDLLAALGLSPS